MREKIFSKRVFVVGILLACICLVVLLWARFLAHKETAFTRDNTLVASLLQERFLGDVEIKQPQIPEKICAEIQPEENTSQSEQTQLLQKAINACVESGGGTLIVQGKRWDLGPLELANTLHLFISEGTTLAFSGPDSWDREVPAFNRFEGVELFSTRPMLSCTNCHDIRISGGGKITGSGEMWQNIPGIAQKESNVAEYSLLATKSGIPPEERIFMNEGEYIRPDMLFFSHSQRVSVEDITLEESPRWTMHFAYGEDIQVERVSVDTEGPNTDGIVLDSVDRVLIEDVRIHSGDDAIVLKSGRDEDGWRVNTPTQNIVLRDIVVHKAHGGITIGSEMSGGVRNVYASAVGVEDARVAARIKAPRGRGGYVENIVFEDFTFDEISESTIAVDMDYSYNVEDDSQHFPLVKNLFFEGFTGKNSKKFVEIQGFKEAKVQNVFFWRSHVYVDRGFDIAHAQNVHVFDSTIEIHKGKQVAQKKAFTLQEVEQMSISNTSIKGLETKHFIRCGKEDEVAGSCSVVLLTNTFHWMHPDKRRESGLLIGPPWLFGIQNIHHKDE